MGELIKGGSMKLVSFDLDLPYVKNEERITVIAKENNCDQVEAIRLDYQQNWKEKRRKFALQTRCISAFFERNFGYIVTKDCQKILVECVPVVTNKSVRNFSGVCAVQVSFDYESFLTLDDVSKKKAVLALLMTGIRIVVSESKWDMEPFESTYFKIVEADYKNEWIWQKSAKSPDKKHIANVLLQHEIDRVDISIIVYDSNKIEVYREKVISELPDEYAYSNHLGLIKWYSNNSVALSNINNNREWSVVFENDV